MKVTEAYRTRMMKEQFEDSAPSTEPAILIRKLNSLGHEANLIDLELTKLDHRKLLATVSASSSRAEENLLEYHIYYHNDEEPELIVITRYPLDKHPEVKQRVAKMVNTLNILVGRQTAIRDQLVTAGYDLTVDGGEWSLFTDNKS